MARDHIVIPRLPALDGLRGIAVLGVLFFHADGALPGGYLGVDLFFVLSGFLITSILVAEQRETGRIDLRAFWIRRARRLFPVLLVLILTIAMYAGVFARPDELPGVRSDAIATLAYVANWHAIFARHSYWELFAAPSPLEHTWSLAIEEQFYVLWPLLVVSVYKLGRGGKGTRARRALVVVSGGLAIASAVTMARLASRDETTHAYLGTDARGGAILAGAILAFVLASRPPVKAVRALDALGIVAALGLATAWARLDGQSAFLYRGGFWLTELGCVVLIACAAQGPASFVARALSFRPLMLVGAISYGIYLWHWPLYVVLTSERAHLSGAWLTLVRIGATFGVAIVSYVFLEQPIRRRGVFFGRARVVVPAAIGIDLGAILWATTGGGVAASVASPVGPPTLALAGIADGSADAPEPLVWDLPAASTLPLGTLRVLVVGDSVAMSLGNLLRVEQAKGRAFVAQRAVGDCSILEGTVPTRTISKQEHAGGDCSASWARDTAELRPDVTIVLLGGGFFASAKVKGTWVAPCDRAWHDVYVVRLQAVLSGLLVHGGRPVLALAPYPVGKWKYLSPKVDCYDAALSEAAAAVPGVTTLDLQTRLCPGGECEIESDGARVRADGLHFEYPGGSRLAQWVLAELRAPSRP